MARRRARAGRVSSAPRDTGGASESSETDPFDDFPPPGPRRDVLVERAEARLLAARAAISTVLQAWLERAQGVTRSRMRGPVARKHTRWWTETKSDGFDLAPAGAEFKAVDAGYVLPDRLVDELETPLRGVVLRVATDAARATASDVGGTVSEMADPFVIDTDLLDDAIEEAVSRLMDISRRHAEMVRAEILRADATADSLDEVLDLIDAAYAKGGKWLLLSGRALSTALTNEAALRQARALGVTHKQWLSRRDGRVRATHRLADTQTREIDDMFVVGGHRLRFPADPTDIPESFPEVAGCRCSMLFSTRPSRRRTSSVDPRAGAVLVGSRPESDSDGDAATLSESITGYHPIGANARVRPGDRVRLPAGTALALTVPATAGVLAVLVPAGVVMATGGNAVELVDEVMAEITAVTTGRVQARVDEKAPASGL